MNEIKDDEKIYYYDDMKKMNMALYCEKEHITYVDGESEFNVDFSDSKGGVIYLVGKIKIPVDKDDLEKGYTIGEKNFLTRSILKPKTIKNDNEEDSLSFEISEGGNPLQGHATSIYSRETVVFISSPIVRNKIIKFFSENKDEDEVMYLSHFSGSVITKPPKDIKGILDGNLMETKKVGRKVSQEEYEKEDLKAYETPSNVFDTLFRAIDKETIKRYLKDEASTKLYKMVVVKETWKKMLRFTQLGKSGELSNTTYLELGDSVIVGYIDDAIEDHINDIFHHLGDTSIPLPSKTGKSEQDILIHDRIISFFQQEEKLFSIFELIEKIYKDGEEKGFVNSFADNQHLFKKAIGRMGINFGSVELPIFDPQAGSGKGMIGGFDSAKFNGKLIGTELRDIDRTDDDERIDVIGGVSTSLYKGVMEESFFSQNHTVKRANLHLLAYLNPPYTIDDRVGKDTVEMFSNGMKISGLFPTKMKNYLMNSLSNDSLILEIPKSVTGYEDEKAPERFLFVMGKKDSLEAFMKEKEIQTNDLEGERSLLTMGKYSSSSKPFYRSLPKDASDADFKKALGVFLSGGGSSLTLGLIKSFEYYGDSKNREDLIFSRMKKNIASKRDIFENIDILTESLDRDKGKILHTYTPLEVAKKQKVFIDPQFYMQSGEYPRYRFDEVSQNIPLLVYYKDNMPNVFNIVKTISEEKGIDLPIDLSPTFPFQLNGDNGEVKKDKVTSLSLGLMKLKYRPTTFDLKSEENKKIFMQVLQRVFNGRLNEDIINELIKATTLADKLVIKSERVTRATEDSTTRLAKPKLVLLDEYGTDIRPLDEIELDEFYDELEASNIYKIEGYVEVVKLSVEKKRMLIKGLIKEMNSPIYAISKHNNITMEDFDERILRDGGKILKDLHSGEMKFDALNGKILEFADEFKLEEIFKDMFKIDEETLKKKLRKVSRETLRSTSLKMTIAIADQCSTFFLKNPILFFEDQKEGTFKALKESLISIANKEVTNERQKEENIEIIESEMSNFITEITEEMNPYYKIQSNITTSYARTAETLLYRYSALKLIYSDTLSDENVDKLYSTHVNGMFARTSGLMPHQIVEGEGFLELSDEKDTKYLCLEPRIGKTRIFALASILVALYKGEDVNLVLETANIPDITEQLMESFPFMMFNARFYGDEKKVITTEKSSFEMLSHDNMYPIPYRMMPQSKVAGGGRKVAELNESFVNSMVDVKKVLNEKYEGEVTREKLLKDYPHSKFRDLLTFECES